jgi:Zn-dependent protease
MNWLWSLVGWVVMFWVLKYGLTVIILSRSRFGRMSGSIVAADRVPENIRKLFDLSDLKLHQLGFRDCGYIEYIPFQRIHPPVRWMQLLVDESGCHFATIELRYPVAAKDPFSITFYTWFTDGHLLLTVDRLAHAIFDRIPNTTLGDNRIHNLERQWDYHRQQYAGIGNRLVSNFDIVGFCDRYFEHFDLYVDRLIATKTFIPTDDDTQYRRRLSGTLAFTHQLISRRPKSQPLAQPIEIPSEIAIDNSRMLEQSQTSTSNRRTKFWWFGLSVIAFYFATIPYMGWEFGVQLLLIILLHELGHLLAMQLFGYRNTSMLFIPFFGGVAMGKNEGATLAQKFWVLMLGPLPGILLEMAMLFISYGNSNLDWWNGFGLWMVGINLLNLLPIYPLDGGKIVGLLLQPYPYIGVVFKVICTVLAIGLGCLGSQIFLFIGIALAVSIPLDLRTARAIAKLQCQPGAAELEKDEWLKWAHIQLDRSSQAPAQPAHQKLFMNSLWEWRSDLHNSPQLRWGLSLLYAVTLIGGTIGSAYGLIGENLPLLANSYIDSYIDDFQTGGMTHTKRQQYYQKRWQRDLQANTAAIARDPNNLQAYRQRLRLHGLLQDKAGQIQDLDRLIIIQPQKLEYLSHRLYLKTDLQQYQSALLDTDLLLQLDPKAKSYIHNQRGGLYAKLGNTDRAIASYSTHLLESSTSRYDAYLERSKLYANKGERQLALADLDLAIASQPKYASGAYLERAKLREQIGNQSGAALDRQKAAKIDAENLEERDRNGL